MKWCSPGILLVIITVLILFIFKICKIRYLDVSNIIKNYFLDFEGRKSKFAAILFIIIFPLLISCQIGQITKLNNDSLNIITLIVSVLTGMFFSLVSVFIDINEKIDSYNELDSTKYYKLKKLNSQMFHSVMFEILISIFILLVSFFSVLSGVDEISWVDCCLIYYLLFVLIFNLFIVLKRVSTLIDIIISKKNQKDDFEKDVLKKIQELIEKIKDTDNE